MAKQQNNMLVEYSQAYQRIQAEMNEQLANGTMRAGSREHRQAMSDLAELKNQMTDVRLELIAINEQIREVNWKTWNNAIAMLEHMNSQLDSTIDIIGDLTSFTDNGKITKNGIAQYNLNASGLANARQKVADYTVAIAKLDEELANNVINQQQYNEELQDYREKQMAAVGDVKKYRDAIIALVKEGIEAETNAMSDLIDKRKEALQRQKEIDDYNKTVTDKEREINKIRAQIAALSGDDSLATQAKVAKLRADLADKEQDLADTRRDHEYDSMVQSLDDELESFKEVQDEKAKALELSLANQEVAIQNTLSWTKTQYKDTTDVLTQIALEYGINLEDSIVTPWKNATNAAKEYKDAIAGVTTTQKKTSNTNKVKKKSNTKAGAGISTTGYVKEATNLAKSPKDATAAYYESIKAPTTKISENTSTSTAKSSGGKLSTAFSSSSLWYGNKANKASDVKLLQKYLIALGYANFKNLGVFGAATDAAVRAFQKKNGIGVDGVVGPKTKAKLIELAKAKGKAAHGKRNAKGLYLTDEQGIGSEAIITKEGVLRQLDSDTVFSKRQTEALWDLSKMNLDSLLSNAAKIVRRDTSVEIHYDSLLSVNGDVTRDALPGLQEILKQACEYTKRDITQSLSKLGYR